jgi:hypothetical protein
MLISLFGESVCHTYLLAVSMTLMLYLCSKGTAASCWIMLAGSDDQFAVPSAMPAGFLVEAMEYDLL